MKFKFLLFLWVFSFTASFAQNIRYGITNNEGKIIPDDIKLISEDSIGFNLKSSLTRPTFIAFVYYRCPGICNATMNGIVEVVNKTELVLGTDFDIYCVSIQNNETPYLAKNKKHNYLQMLKDKDAGKNWKFCTTDSLTISRFTNFCGFEFQKKGKDIIHPATLIMLTPKGKISQYLYGTYFMPMDLELAVKAAKNEEISEPRIKKINYCYSKKYELNKNAVNFITVTSVAAFAALFAAIIVLFVIKKRKTN